MKTRTLVLTLALLASMPAAAQSDEWSVEFHRTSVSYTTPTGSAQVAYADLIAPKQGADPWHDDNIQLALMMMDAPPPVPLLQDPDSLIAAIDELVALLDEATSELSARDVQIGQLETQLAEAATTIENRDVTIAEQAELIAQLENQVAPIEEIEERLDALEDAINYALSEAAAAMQRYRNANP